MGEIAEMHLNGILCERCGEYIGEEVGYPRLCGTCEREDIENAVAAHGGDLE